MFKNFQQTASNFLRCARSPNTIQFRGKKEKKLKIAPLEGEEARYFNPSLMAGVNEPEYLNLLKPPTPFYEFLNLKLECLDFTVIEKFTSYLQKRFRLIDFNVHHYWPLQFREYQFQVLKSEDVVMEQTMVLKFYRRVLQLKDVSAEKIPLLIEIMDAAKPPGLTYMIDKHSSEDEPARYVFNTQLEQLKIEMNEALSELDFSGEGVKK